MVLLASTVTALQTLLVVCRAYAGPHDIAYNTTKTVCVLVRPLQSQGLFSTRVRLRYEELSFIKEFCYLGHIMTAEIRILKNNQGGKMHLAICWSGNSHLLLLRTRGAIAICSNCSSHIVTPFMDVLFGVIHSRTLLENFLSVIVTHSSVLLTSPDTSARVF